MSNQQIAKLKRKGLSAQMASKLVEAGFYTPKLIKAASGDALLSVAGLKSEDVETVRAQIG